MTQEAATPSHPFRAGAPVSHCLIANKAFGALQQALLR